MQRNKKEYLLQILDELSRMEELQNIPGTSEELERLRERLSDDEFRIAVVGEFSSGKSTFINAMLGRDILQHATTETTAAVTRIVNVEMEDPRRMTGRVITRDGRDISMPDLGDLKEYTTTQSERYRDRVPEEIAAVEIYLPFMVLSRPVVLVDTPGLNGMAEGHREQTVALIQKAHACIYLIPRGGLGESDILFLTYLAKFQKNFIFIQNFIDEFQISQGDSVPKKLAEQREILDRKIFAEETECVYDICGVSALMELASADQHIERLYADSPSLLTPEDRIRLHEQSGFEDFRRLMGQTFREERMDDIQYGGAARAIANWTRSLLDHISTREQQARDFYEASRDKRTLEKLEHLREKILAGEQRQRENLQNFILARGDEIRKEECGSLRESFKELDGQVYAQMAAIPQLPALEQFEKELPGRLENRVGTILAESNARLRQKFQTLYQVLLTRIDEYSGIKSTEELDLESLTLRSLPDRQPSFKAAQGRIEKWEDDLEGKRQEALQLQNTGCAMEVELRKAQQSEAAAQRAQREIENQRDRDLAQMGGRPAASEHKESYTDYEYRGGLGFLDWLCGPKEVIRYRTVRDDSAGKAWDQRKAEIQNAFAVRNDSLSKELAAARRQKTRVSAMLDANQTKARSIEEVIRRLGDKIALEREKLEQEKRQAAQEYLELRRTSLHQQIHVYLLGESGVLAETEEAMKSIAEETEQAFVSLAMDRFTRALEQKLQWIQETMREKRPGILRQAENLSEIGNQLRKILEEMERD